MLRMQPLMQTVLSRIFQIFVNGAMIKTSDLLVDYELRRILEHTE